jgi:hypothetical protein
MAWRPIQEIFVLSAKDFSPPLYYIVLKVWMVVFGSDVIATRSLSLLCFALTLFVMHEILVIHFKVKIRKALPLVLFFGVLNPLLMYYAFETRGYSMFAFFATLAWYAYLRGRRVLYTLASLLGLFTHYFMALVIGTHMLMSVCQIHPSWTPRQFIRQILAIAAPFSGWICFVLTQKDPQTVHSFWIMKPNIHQLIDLPSFVLLGAEPNVGFDYYALPGSLLLYSCTFIAYMHARRNNHKSLGLILWWLLPTFLVFVMSLFTTSLYLSRYLIFATVGIILMICYLLAKIQPLWRVVVFVLCGVMMITFLRLQLTGYVKEDIAGKVEKIKKLAKPGDELWLRDEMNFHTAQYYWFHPNDVKIIGKPYAEIPAYVGKVLIPETATKSLYAHPRNRDAYLLETKQKVSFRF